MKPDLQKCISYSAHFNTLQKGDYIIIEDLHTLPIDYRGIVIAGKTGQLQKFKVINVFIRLDGSLGILAQNKKERKCFYQTSCNENDVFIDNPTQNNVCGTLDRYSIQKKKTHGFWVIQCRGLFTMGYVKHSFRLGRKQKPMPTEAEALKQATKFHNKWEALLFCWLYNKDAKHNFRLQEYSVKWIHKEK